MDSQVDVDFWYVPSPGKVRITIGEEFAKRLALFSLYADKWMETPEMQEDQQRALHELEHELRRGLAKAGVAPRWYQVAYNERIERERNNATS